ncbi:hypothetical protein PAXRUDRAFT_648682 [Paxillus rubicundulus Ve08.2h10]|uniref:Uncharacterized protein n=1 Tax=Paxillus rubicundulus Ve08.2h10 TaxID=930991 RepID=A0A0D0DXJ6_9AGAM|nr:hypothetical protein PAXRUDRAFT_648682 [Paxillus rubicundulus Ve08.2h10]
MQGLLVPFPWTRDAWVSCFTTELEVVLGRIWLTSWAPAKLFSGDGNRGTMRQVANSLAILSNRFVHVTVTRDQKKNFDDDMANLNKLSVDHGPGEPALRTQ